MKISCTQENLSKGLNLVSHIASKDINLPILKNVLLKTENKLLKVSVTNLEIGITSLIRSRVDQDGDFTVPAKVLSDYINLLPKEQIDLVVKNDILTISGGNYETEIKGNSVADFPVIPNLEKKVGFKINIIDFKKALQKVIFAATISDLRPEISGILLSFVDQKLTMTATDSYRLAEVNISFKLINNKIDSINYSFIIPLKTAQEILRILNFGNDLLIDDEQNEATLYLADNQILLENNNTELVSKLIEGQYPDYKQIIPQDFKTNLIIDKDELQKAIKMTSLFSKTESYDISLVASSKTGEVEIFAENSQLGKNSVRLQAQVSGEDNKIVLNFKYLLDGLQNIETQQVAIDIVNDSLPCLFRPYQDDKIINNYLYLIMPIRQ